MMVKTKSNRCEFGCQYHLNLDLSDQSRPKTKNLFIEYFLKN